MCADVHVQGTIQAMHDQPATIIFIKLLHHYCDYWEGLANQTTFTMVCMYLHNNSRQ